MPFCIFLQDHCCLLLIYIWHYRYLFKMTTRDWFETYPPQLVSNQSRKMIFFISLFFFLFVIKKLFLESRSSLRHSIQFYTFLLYVCRNEGTERESFVWSRYPIVSTITCMEGTANINLLNHSGAISGKCERILNVLFLQLCFLY